MDRDQEMYLRSALSGQIGEPETWRFQSRPQLGRLIEHATRNRLVAKFCRLNRMLHFFHEQYDVRGIVFIVRHPCAVVSSMLDWYTWEEGELSGETRREQVLHWGPIPELLEREIELILANLSTQAEVLAMTWCLDHYIPVVYHAEMTGTYPWILVPYERLVRHGAQELRRITQALGLEMTPEMKESLPEPSSSVKDTLPDDRDQQLSKWKRRLSTQQIDVILSIVDSIGPSLGHRMRSRTTVVLMKCSDRNIDGKRPSVVLSTSMRR